MISEELLEILRCPMDHGQSRLEAAADGLVCTRCRLKFPVKEGIPCMLVEEAELPPGADSLSALPCQQPGAPSRASPPAAGRDGGEGGAQP